MALHVDEATLKSGKPHHSQGRNQAGRTLEDFVTQEHPPGEEAEAFGTLASRLENCGLIRRVNGACRAIRPDLTEHALRMFSNGRAVTERVVRASFSPLDAKEQAALGEMLEKLLTQ